MMKLIAITSETTRSTEPDHINRLFRAGLSYLHIRKPEAKEEDVHAFIKCIDSYFYQRIIIHRHLPLRDKMKLGGIHLPLETFQVQINSPFEGILSASAHCVAACHALHKANAHLFISPVFDSISKSGYIAKPDLIQSGAIPRTGKLIALGGISSEKIREVKERGFDGAALLGYLWHSNDPVARFLQLQKQLTHHYGN